MEFPVNKPQVIVVDKRETFFQSWSKDVVTFGFLALCIYVSRDSRWWTFFTGCMSLVWIAAQAKGGANTFKSKAELKAWVDGLEDF